MSNWKLVGLLVLVVGASGFAWLREHDSNVRWEALAKARADSLAVEQKRTDAMKKAVISLDSAFAKANKKHLDYIAATEDSVETLSHRIDVLADAISKDLPDSAQGNLIALKQACTKQKDLLTGALTDCEFLKAQSIEQNARRDTIIGRLQSSADRYKELYTESIKAHRTDSWSTVGKIETAGGILAIITKLFGLW